MSEKWALILTRISSPSFVSDFSLRKLSRVRHSELWSMHKWVLDKIGNCGPVCHFFGVSWRVSKWRIRYDRLTYFRSSCERGYRNSETRKIWPGFRIDREKLRWSVFRQLEKNRGKDLLGADERITQRGVKDSTRLHSVQLNIFQPREWGWFREWSSFYVDFQIPIKRTVKTWVMEKIRFGLLLENSGLHPFSIRPTCEGSIIQTQCRKLMRIMSFG